MAPGVRAAPIRLVHTFSGCAASTSRDRSTMALRGRPHPVGPGRTGSGPITAVSLVVLILGPVSPLAKHSDWGRLFRFALLALPVHSHRRTEDERLPLLATLLSLCVRFSPNLFTARPVTECGDSPPCAFTRPVCALQGDAAARTALCCSAPAVHFPHCTDHAFLYPVHITRPGTTLQAAAHPRVPPRSHPVQRNHRAGAAGFLLVAPFT